MQINRVNKTNRNFTGLWNNKVLLKTLEKVSDHGTSFSVGTGLAMSLFVRPLVILSTPNVEKENKQYACANSICSALIKFGMVEAVALPIENVVKKIEKNPNKYLTPSTIKNLNENNKALTDSKSFRLASQIIKLSTGFLTAIPKSMLSIALIPIVMDKIFDLKIIPTPKVENSLKKIPPNKEIPFTGKLANELPKKIGKIFDIEVFQNFVKKYRNHDKDISKHITAATDILLTGTSAYQIKKNKKIKENRKKPQIYNNLISTGITLTGGYSLDRLMKNKTSKFIEKFSQINAKDPKLAKYIEGINIIRPAIIFAGIYYGLLPMLSIYLAEKTDKYLLKP